MIVTVQNKFIWKSSCRRGRLILGSHWKSATLLYCVVFLSGNTTACAASCCIVAGSVLAVVRSKPTRLNPWRASVMGLGLWIWARVRCQNPQLHWSGGKFEHKQEQKFEFIGFLKKTWASTDVLSATLFLVLSRNSLSSCLCVWN